MKVDIAKIYFFLFILFLLDIIKPFNFYFKVEFLFLGIIFFSLYYSSFSILLAIFIFGYIKDCFALQNFLLNTIEFIIVYFAGNFLNLDKNLQRFVFPFLCIIFHILVQSIYFWSFTPLFIFHFFIHSMVSYFLIEYLLKRWMQPLLNEYI
ncbi:MAG: hypothetical protein NC935_00490 [Candidatus Omnitrophica bacterium]|nr:hypothetical protein [Candidatus Omnitrophota bacterium]